MTDSIYEYKVSRFNKYSEYKLNFVILIVYLQKVKIKLITSNLNKKNICIRM